MVRKEVYTSLAVSLFTATLSTIIISSFGIPLGYILAKYNFRGKIIVNFLVLIPLVIPPLASGALLLGVFGPYSSLGSIFPFNLTQSLVGIIISQVYIASPFMILSSQTAFKAVDPSYEHASRILGKAEFDTFLLVTLPLSKLGLLVGLTLTWIRSLGELGATLMMAYNPNTISIRIFEDNALGGIYYAVPSIISVILVIMLLLLMSNSIGRFRSSNLSWM